MSRAPTDTAPPACEEARRARQRRKAWQARIDRLTRELVTPEGAALHLRIGTFGERAGAFLIDFIIQWTIGIIIILAIAWGTARLGLSGWAIGGALIGVFVFFLRNFYFVWFEMGRRAATPGKRIVGLRVTARDGGELKAEAVLARNFMREIEVGLPLSFLFMAGDELNAWIGLFGFLWSGVFMFFPLLNRDRLRVGDLVAGTWVIHAPKTKLLKDITSARPPGGAAEGSFAFSPAQVEAYGIHELHVLEDVLRRSTPTVKGEVAARIRQKIGWQAQPGEKDLDFLEAYYGALRARLEQRMLFGERKEDKFDR
ncbi:MAG: RDD family protein [Alphaproteobacteria bacterium]|jgi:uncharacterized RDD family membrane protein YckC|nr:RDD family protein [Alphaproteobacteria bacterium]